MLSENLEPGSYAHRFLALLDTRGSLNGQTLAELLGVKPSEVSRQGKRLRRLGLADSERHGRFVFWSLAAAGRAALRDLSARERAVVRANGDHGPHAVESLLLAVEYRLVPQQGDAWALVREASPGGVTKLKLGSFEECQAAWDRLAAQATALSDAEIEQAADLIDDLDRLAPNQA